MNLTLIRKHFEKCFAKSFQGEVRILRLSPHVWLCDRYVMVRVAETAPIFGKIPLPEPDQELYFINTSAFNNPHTGDDRRLPYVIERVQQAARCKLEWTGRVRQTPDGSLLRVVTIVSKPEPCELLIEEEKVNLVSRSLIDIRQRPWYGSTPAEAIYTTDVGGIPEAYLMPYRKE